MTFNTVPDSVFQLIYTANNYHCMKITSKHLSVLYDLSAEQFNAVEMHSFLNLINVIQMQLEILKMDTGKNDLFDEILKETAVMTTQIRDHDKSQFFPEHVKPYQKQVLDLIHYLDAEATDEALKAEIDQARTILQEVFKVMDVRSEELRKRASNPGQWHSYTIDEFKSDFNSFFHAVEKNSHGRYRIVQNIARQQHNDYLIHFDVDSELNGLVTMPIIFKDVIRDLIANARKYTDPGGRIHIGIYQKKNLLRFIVEDNGIGIPNGELERIFEYGYRASNVGNAATMGGGFGLTKALYITTQLNGDLWIDSEEGQGTKIRIEIPVPEKLVKTHA